MRQSCDSAWRTVERLDLVVHTKVPLPYKEEIHALTLIEGNAIPVITLRRFLVRDNVKLISVVHRHRYVQPDTPGIIITN
ncbi:hypothetical protein ATW55_14970 [Ferroacidibacillus organovorans]|uniref:Uncharacterized protein n=1 Tax=Ferroacidibacillus organovorans TaxID=1765683 RepID=A0A124IVZ4_9BACL|nr:hypothetical protein ATW55_14970 [Ferroacidibacillus organovorans]